jgi:hypothetical protein
MMLTGSADAKPADWVVARVRDFDYIVGSVVPARLPPSSA